MPDNHAVSEQGALSHIRVMDLSRVLAGPWATQTLADLGADVIKVERPVSGDETRDWGPPFMADKNGEPTEESAYFLCTNRGKRSLCVDITSEDGQALLHKLVAQCDVVIENYKTGQAKKYRLDYESLSAINPGIVYCSITGFGHSGPYSQRPGYDFLVQAMGGLMSVTGEPDREPQKVGVALTDIMTGLYAGIGILAALAERDRSGTGQHIDLALLDVTVATLANQAANYLVGEQVPTPMGNSHPNIVPYQCFATSDGHCVVAVGNDVQFQRFCEVLEFPDLAQDPDYATNSGRVSHRETLIPLIEARMVARKRDEWLAAFEQADVPAAPINKIDEVFDDPQVSARGMKISMPHPVNDNLQLVGNPLKLSRTPVHYQRPPPMLGEHTDEIISELDRVPSIES